jgi:Flp pilus assembly protein TadD
MKSRDVAPPSADPDLLFHRGFEALNRGYPSRAVGYFRSAASAERPSVSSTAGLRALSYYGLSLALAEGPSAEAIDACERAAALGGPDADLVANLGWVYLLAGRRTTALSALDCAREMNARSHHPRALPSPERRSATRWSGRLTRRRRPHRSIRGLPAAAAPPGI